MTITQVTSTANTTAKAGRKIEYIVLHYTAGTSSAAGMAAAVARMFANPERKGSADFIVDDGSVVQYNPDIRNRYCWSVGGAKYTSMTTKLGGTLHGYCQNNNSISIELCSSKTNKKSLSATDTDWYFTEDVIANGLWLVRRLMEEYNIPLERVVTHHHVTGKICPNPWTVNQDRLAGYRAFLGKLQGDNISVKEEEPEMTKAEIEKLVEEKVAAKLATITDITGTGDNPSPWAKDAAEWAKANGLFTGDGNGNYGWQKPITREQAAALMKRMLERPLKSMEDSAEKA